MTDSIRPGELFNIEDSNTSANPSFEHVLETRLSRRHVLRGAVGAVGVGALGVTGLSGCATVAPSANAPAALSTLGFKPVAKSLADRVIVPEGYTARVLYALGDLLP